MAIKFQYNKTSLGDLGKQLKMRQKALPTIKSKESALRSEVKKAKDTAQDFRRQLDALTAQYDYMVSLWGEFDADLLRIADVDLAEQKIAGVSTPVLQDIRFEEKDTTSSRLPCGSPTESIFSSASRAWVSSSRCSTARWSCWISHAARLLRR